VLSKTLEQEMKDLLIYFIFIFAIVAMYGFIYSVG